MAGRLIVQPCPAFPGASSQSVVDRLSSAPVREAFVRCGLATGGMVSTTGAPPLPLPRVRGSESMNREAERRVCQSGTHFGNALPMTDVSSPP